MENPRTTTARDHDDHDLIEGNDPAPAASGSAGGNLARDIATQSEEDELVEPDSSKRVQKDDAMHNDTARRTRRPR